MLRGVPLVWLSNQPIDHQAGFATIRGGALRRETEGQNRWVLARGRFTAPEGVAELRLAVDGRYRAWLSGQPFGRGPVRSSPYYPRYDHYMPRMLPGEGLLALVIHVPGVDLAWYETTKGAWQPVFGDGGLYAELRSPGGDLCAIDWKLLETDAWSRDTPRSGWGQDFIEDFDARRLDPEWIEPGYDDREWASARPMNSEAGSAEVARGWGPVEPWPSMTPSELPPPLEASRRPSRLLYVCNVKPRPDLDVAARLYSEAWVGDASSRVLNPGALTGAANGFAIVNTGGDSDTGLMFEFESYHAGYPFIELDAKGGEVIEVAVAEAVPGELGRGKADDGLRHEGHLGVAHVARYTARTGRQRFDKFNWTAVRAMQVVVRNAPEGVGLRVGSTATHYDARPDGEFECSDPFLNRLWAVGRNTVRQCMHDGWVDCPGREGRQWVGDALVAFDVSALAFGSSIYPLHRQFLHHAAESQRADGLVRMFAPGDIGADALVIPDFTLLWIITLERYVRHSGDRDTVSRLLPAVERALHWFERQTGQDGLLRDIPYWHFIEWAHIDRRGIPAAINALYIGALKAVSAIALFDERPRLAARCALRAQQVAEALGQSHWDHRRGLYVDSVDTGTGRQRSRASQHANSLLLLFDAVPVERIASVVAAITDRSRLKLTAAPPIVLNGEEFDEQRDIVMANTFFSHFVYDGLAQAGSFEWVLDSIRRNYGPMLATGATTLWESFAPTASLCHAFSATPVYQLSSRLLGVNPLEPGYRRFSLRPDCGDLEWARGTIPTPAGPIAVEWTVTSGARALEISVDHPPECELELSPDLIPRLLAERRTATGRQLTVALS